MTIKNDIQVGEYKAILDAAMNKLIVSKDALVEPKVFEPLENYYNSVKKVLTLFDDHTALAYVYGSDIRFPNDLVEAIEYFANNPDASLFTFKKEIENTESPLVLYSAMKAYYANKDEE
jgi:hypothetical protein